MEHQDYLIDLLSEQGEVSGTKRRGDVDKSTDWLHTVCILVHSPNRKILFTQLPRNIDQGRAVLGCTAATILRHDETLEQAAERALQTDLAITLPLSFIDSQFFPTIKRRVSVFTARLEPESMNSDHHMFATIEQIPSLRYSPVLNAALDIFSRYGTRSI